MRVLRIVIALLAVPMFAAVSQGRRSDKAETRTCTAEQAEAVARALAAGRQIPPGLAHCAAPAPEAPPTGPHKAVGVIYDDLDGNGSRDMFAGEMGLSGWTVTLFTSTGVFAGETTTDVNGAFVFSDLGNTTWNVCITLQSGYRVTVPASGSTCNSFTSSGTLETWYPSTFGVTTQ